MRVRAQTLLFAILSFFFFFFFGQHDFEFTEYVVVYHTCFVPRCFCFRSVFCFVSVSFFLPYDLYWNWLNLIKYVWIYIFFSRMLAFILVCTDGVVSVASFALSMSRTQIYSWFMNNNDLMCVSMSWACAQLSISAYDTVFCVLFLSVQHNVCVCVCGTRLCPCNYS